MDLFSQSFPEPDRKPVRKPPRAAASEGDAEPVESVTRLTRRIKNLLEDGIGNVWVEGEISNHRRQASGHHYFTLKDAGAQLPCVLFKGSVSGSRVPLADGLAVQVAGEITVYEARGQYQMIVRQVRPAGVGALQARFEALKRKLMEEGLFSQEQKRRICRFPRTVAVVTSPTGAALQDMLNILGRRAPWLRVLVFPVRVQGAEAAGEIAAALRLIGSRPPGIPEIDTVVVARGGGSLEDLWAFNEEEVARAVHACPVPVVSAVGHEIDFTIADFVADLRAPTPSAAAELIVPDGAELRASLQQTRTILARRVEQKIQGWRRELEMLRRGPLNRESERVLLPWRQRLDEAAGTLAGILEEEIRRRTRRLELLARRLEQCQPAHLLAARQAALDLLRERLASRAAAVLARRRNQLAENRVRLKSLGPQSVLARGFSYTVNAAGKVVREASELRPGEEFTTRLARGRVRAVAREAME